jgi:hypothetical protein
MSKTKPISDSLQAYLDQLKTRQIKDYALTELSDIIDEVADLYRKTKNETEVFILQGVYTKLTDWYNFKMGKQIYNKEIKC